MKKLITLLLACLSCFMLTKAELPFKPSTDTGNGAIWYVLKWWYEDGDNSRYVCWKTENLNNTLVIDWSIPNSPSDNHLFCFIGNEEDGFEIYNKAMLAGATYNDQVLAEDLKLQSFLPIGNDIGIGYTNEAADVSKNITKWKVKADANEKYALVASDDDTYFLWRSGDSKAITFKADYTWEGAFALQFLQITQEPLSKSAQIPETVHIGITSNGMWTIKTGSNVGLPTTSTTN